MTFFEFLLIGLASFQVSRWITWEMGPFDMFARFREYTLSVTRAFSCQYCMGFWAVLAMIPVNREAPIVVAVLAVVGLHTLLAMVADRLVTYR